MAQISLEPVRRREPLVAQVAERVRERIATGHWAVGHRIPGENELAKEFQVSRGTVREALRALTIAGVLDPRIGDGTYVFFDDELSALLAREAENVTPEMATDVRSVLEAAAAEQAAAHATVRQIEDMRSALVTRQRAHDRLDHATYKTADLEFHRLLLTASGNHLLARLHRAIESTMTRSMAHATPLPERAEVGQLHWAIIDAISDRDAATAALRAVRLIKELAIHSPRMERSSE
jgi:DNA-binding FadR family transcriptional regulator